MPALGFLRLWVWAGALTLSATLVAQDAKESPPKPLPVPEVGTPVRVRVSEKISQTLLVAKVPPHYPDEARAKHIEGSVVLVTEISPEGAVESMKVVSGDSLLATAATEAVKQWKYKPFLLNRKPIAVETQVTVRFTLSAQR